MSDAERAAGDDGVKLRNNLRRPIVFRAAGRTHRLPPGGDMEVPESWLASTELQRLCGGGQLSAVRPQVARAAEIDEAERADDDAEQADDQDTAAEGPSPERGTGRKSETKRRTPRAKE
jgi:hypothetical protein